MRALEPLSLWLLLSVVGCHTALDQAVDHYTDGRYPSAAAEFRRAEPLARELGRADFAKYALYRGLSHLALGDARAAALWVGRAKQLADRDPKSFNDQDRGALIAAWRSMGHMPGEPGFAVKDAP